jgi:lipid II:glycine glycyltransferase (peptidoglycan interpeptide bridge formation enzyme)
MVRVILASIDGQPAATSIELLFKDVVYGWYGGLDRSYSAYVPNELLMWDILKWGAESSYQIYDFGGAGKPNEKYGVRDFKAKFGGDLVCFGRNTYIHRPGLFDLSKAGYRLYQSLKGLG